METTTVPDYYPKFKCIGPQCEDTCCSGWTVSIDRDTYHKYKLNKHKLLAPLFKLAVKKNTESDANSINNFGLMLMKSDGSCHFQQEDKLCAIQNILGEQALSYTCKLYPRYLNQFGSQREMSLAISCPEAARLILLNPDPIQFQMMALKPVVNDPTFTCYKFPMKNDGDLAQIEILNDFRAVIISILQHRGLTLGARMMVLGCLLDDADKIVTSDGFLHASELSPTLRTFVGMLDSPKMIESQFEQIKSNTSRKLELMTHLISISLVLGATARLNACLLDAAEGLSVDKLENNGRDDELLVQYHQNFHAFYEPFFENRQSIFENYLVNQVICRLFPFTRGSYLDLYRELVFNFAIIKILLVGMAAKHKGLDEIQVVRLIQSFSRKSDHNSHHLDTLAQSIGDGSDKSFVGLMWLLKDVDI